MCNYRTALGRLEEQCREIEIELGRCSGTLEAELQTVTLQEVRAAIPEDGALVEVVRYRPFHPDATATAHRWGAPRYVAYVLRRAGPIAWVDLGEAHAIETAVSEHLPRLCRDPAGAKVAARALDE